MLPLPVVQEIERHLHEGRLSQRKIAALVRVSRATVGAIASGRRGSHGRESAVLGIDSLEGQLPPRRCPACGHLVYWPCVICQARDYRRRARRMKRLMSSERNGPRGPARKCGAATALHPAVA